MMERQGQLQPRAPISEGPAEPPPQQCPGRRVVSFLVGLDWAATTYAVCVIDAADTVRWRETVPYSAMGLAEPVRRLSRCGSPPITPVAFVTRYTKPQSAGPLVERLRAVRS